MRNWHLLAALLPAASALLACGDRISDEGDPRVCASQGVYYGCADIAVRIVEPPRPWPEIIHWDVRAKPARTNGTGEGGFSLEVNSLGITLVRVHDWGTQDTASYWVVVRLMEVPQPIPVGVPLPVFAADSVLINVRYARLGYLPIPDTVQLSPKILDHTGQD